MIPSYSVEYLYFEADDYNNGNVEKQSNQVEQRKKEASTIS